MKILVGTLGICLLALTVAAADEVMVAPLAPTVEFELESGALPEGGQCGDALERALFTATGSGGSLVTCTATCGSYSSVSCSTSGTCTAVDRSCPGQRGYVTCGSTTTYCPPCECTNGTFRFVATGNCCDCGLAEKERQQCVNGVWEFVSIICGPGPGCPWCP